MTCTEAYKEHIMYPFYGFCNVVIRDASITSWRDRQRRHNREIFLEYLTKEKFYPLGTTDEYFTAPYEEIPRHSLMIYLIQIVLGEDQMADHLKTKNLEIVLKKL